MANIVFRETHVCPVGELCPSNVLELIVEPRRCGLCPLAVKTVEHIPAMTAKMRSLLEQIEEAISVIEMMRKRKEPAASISAVADRRRLDVLEYESWKLSLLIAEEDRRKLESAPKTVFRVGMPDVVRLHLKMVAKDSDVASFLIERLTDSRHYSTFETPNLRAKAAQLRQRLVSSGTAVRGEMDSVEEIDPVDALLSTLKISLESRGVEPTFRKAVETARASMVVGQQTPHVLLEKSGEAGDGS